jgi:hypothetical protein
MSNRENSSVSEFLLALHLKNNEEKHAHKSIIIIEFLKNTNKQQRKKKNVEIFILLTPS